MIACLKFDRTGRVGRGGLAATMVALFIATFGGRAFAVVLPRGPIVAGAVGGGATFDYSVPGALTVNQSATRVVIDWTSFSIGAGGTVNFNQISAAAIAFNRVNIDPTTGLSPLSTIAGSLNALGGVWLFSTGGILFGPTAVVNVGSFAGVTGPLAVAGGIDQLLNPDLTGLFTVGIDPPIASGVESITLQSGAQITAKSGFVALQAETMTQNGAITALDGVGYAVAEIGQVRFTTSAAGQQLQSAGITPLVGRDRASFSHGGATNGGWVGIDTPGGAMQAGYHTLINLDGVIQATGIKPGSADKGVVLLVGLDLGPAYPGYTGSSIGIDASGGAILATNGLYISTDSVRLGAVTLGGPLDVTSHGDLRMTLPVVVGGDARLNSNTGTLAVDANLSVDGAIIGTAGTIAIGPGVTVQSDALGGTAGGVVLSAAGDVIADPSSLLLAGADPAAPTDNITVKAGSPALGGNIVLGPLSGAQVFVQSHSAGVASEGAITLAGNILGTIGVTALVDDVSVAGQAAGDLRILAGVTSPGFVDLENLGSAATVVGPGAAVTSSGGQVFVYSGGDTMISPGATVSGVSILDHTVGLLTVASGASLTTTGAPPAPIAPVIGFGSDVQRTSGLNLAAGGMVIQGSVKAGTAAAADDIYIEALGPAGTTAVIGGAGGGPGFDLSNASFSHLSARDVVVMGGPGEATAPGANLLVQDLTLNSANLSSLWLGTASSRSISITGAVTPTGGGPVEVRLGFVRLGQGGTYSGGPVTNPGTGGLDGFIPGEIDVTGALGVPASPLASAVLVARRDIFAGDAAFVAAARADPAFDAAVSSSAYPGYTPGQVFVAARSLQLGAQGRVIQQNTGPSNLNFAGLTIGAPTAALQLVFAPAALGGQSIGGGAWAADYAAGPGRVDLFGALTLAGGHVVDDATAAFQPNLLDPAIPGQAAYRINGCEFGGPCTSLAADVVFATPQSIVAASTSIDTVFGAPGAPTEVVSTLTATAVTLRQDDERLGGSNPVTETGNGDLSSGASDDCPAKPEPGQDCRRP